MKDSPEGIYIIIFSKNNNNVNLHIFIFFIKTMIAFLRGTVFEKLLDNSLFIDVNDIGYKVFVPLRISEKYTIKDKIFLYTFHRLGDGIDDLYGMETREELDFFQLLLSVSGIGPKSALAMSEIPFSSIQKAIEEEDIAFITKTPGVGKKTASRLILELKGKLPNLSTVSGGKNKQKYADIFITLESLGFLKKDIEEVFAKIPENISDKNDEEIIKWGLKELSQPSRIRC